MSYTTYTTAAIVCGAVANNTSDKSYLLFTKQFGMLYATAKSVREERSRQRYALQECAVVNISLVKGKAGWRIGSVEAVAQPFLSATNRTARAHVVAVVQFLRRFLQGEEPAVGVYEDSVQLLTTAQLGLASSAALLAMFEFRALAALGYIAVPTSLSSVLENDVWHHEQTAAQVTVEQLYPYIERGKQSSQL